MANITFQIKHEIVIWLHLTNLNQPLSRIKVFVYSEKAWKSEKSPNFTLNYLKTSFSEYMNFMPVVGYRVITVMLCICASWDKQHRVY